MPHDASPHWRRTAGQAVRTVRGDLLRMAGALFVAAGLTLAIGMIYPVQYVLDTAGYRETSARSVGPVVAPVDTREVSTALDGASVLLEAVILTEVIMGARAVDNVSLTVVADATSDLDLTLMPEVTRTAGSHRADRIDLSADIAATLDVGPGEVVEVRVGPEDLVALKVGGVYGTREFGSRGIARVSAEVLEGKIDPLALVPTQVRTDASPETLESAMARDPWRSGLLEDGYTEPFEAASMADSLRTAEEGSRRNLGLIVAIGIVSLIALIGVVVTETIGLMRTSRRRGAVLVTLGMTPRGFVTPVVVATGAVSLVALGAGGAAGRLAYTTGWLAPALPSALEPGWWGVVTVAALVASTAAAVGGRSLTRQLAS